MTIETFQSWRQNIKWQACFSEIILKQSFPLQRTFPTSSVSLWMRMILSIRSSPFHHRCGESRQTSQSDVKEHDKASEDGSVNSEEPAALLTVGPTALHQQRPRNVKDFSYFWKTSFSNSLPFWGTEVANVALFIISS